MIGVQFYPTPKHVARKLFSLAKDDILHRRKYYWRNFDQNSPWCWEFYIRKSKWLDPSAGKGDLIRHMTLTVPRDIANEYEQQEKKEALFDSRSSLDIDVIEIDPTLQQTLKDYTIVGTDFLEYKTPLFYDYIIMNPPFESGVDHVLHAYEWSEGGTILAIINAETLRNPYTKKRQQLVDIIENEGFVEYENDAFSDAERKAKVDVAYVRIDKPKVDRFDFGFDYEKDSMPEDFYEFSDSQQLAMRESKLEMLERHAKEAIANFHDAMVSFTKLDRLVDACGGYGYDKRSPMQFIQSLGGDNPQAGYREALKNFSQMLKENAWINLLDNSKFKARLDSKTKKDFAQFISDQQNMAFTARNMMSVMEMLIVNQGVYQKQAIETAFDYMTRFHKENREAIGGWKTNDAFQVPKKIILPYGCTFGSYDSAETYRNYGSTFSVGYDRYSEWADIDLAASVVDGKNSIDHLLRHDDEGNVIHNRFKGETIHNTLERVFSKIGKVKPGEPYNNEVESYYFRLKFYKKGTIHLWWKDDKLRERFNRMACEGRGWLKPADYNEAESSPDFAPEDGALTLF